MVERICVWCLLVKVAIVPILHSYFFWIFLRRRILIIINNMLKYLSCIKIAYHNNNNNDNDDNNNNNNNMGFGQAGAKRCGGCLKVINWGWRCKSQKRSSLHREGRFSLCNTAIL